MNNIQELIEQIKKLEKKLSQEMQKKQDEFLYQVRGKRVLFEETVKQYHKTKVYKAYKYVLNAPVLTFFTTPVIWFCLVPAGFMDLVVTFYQAICFPIYRIPKVRRGDFIVLDRHALSYLNVIEKINCVYCGYFNGLIAYVSEVAARTEQYWCPIKHARRVHVIHSRYRKFLEYGDAEGYRKYLEEIRGDFEDLSQEEQD